MIANYHTHSRWCRHAKGEIEDYVKEAVRHGLAELAITEHVPHRHVFTWMPWEELPAYDEELNRVIGKYRNQIHMIKGFECEYYPVEMEDYQMIRETYGYDFLILGQHCIGKNQEINSFGRKEGRHIRMYADEVCEGLESGMFVMLAHPDCVMHRYYRDWDSDCEAAFRQIFSACEKLHIPVEINLNGLREGRGYPNEHVWSLSKQYSLKYLMNSDAHNPAHLCDRAVIGKAEAMAERLGIHIEETFPWNWKKGDCRPE